MRALGFSQGHFSGSEMPLKIVFLEASKKLVSTKTPVTKAPLTAVKARLKATGGHSIWGVQHARGWSGAS